MESNKRKLKLVHFFLIKEISIFGKDDEFVLLTRLFKVKKPDIL